MTVVTLPPPPPSPPYNAKDTPEFRLRVWPQAAITQRTRESFGISDLFNSVLLEAGNCDAADTETTAGKGLSSVGRNLLVGPLIRWVTFDNERAYYGMRAALEHRAGLTCAVLRPREVWLNSRVRGNGGAPEGIKSATLCWWKPRKGKAWTTVRAQRDPRVTGIYHTVQTPDHDVSIETELPLPANQGFRLHLEGLQIAQGQKTQARLRVTWGGTYSVVMRQGAPPTLERRTAGGPWTLWRELTACGNGDLTKTTSFRAYREAGRLLLGIGDTFINVMDTREVDTQPESRQTAEVGWGAGKLALTFYGATVRFELALLDWSYIEREKRSKDAVFARRFERNGKGALDPGAFVREMGWRPGSSKIKMKLCSDPHTQAPLETKVGTQELFYVCALKAAKGGRESPSVSGVLGYCRPEHETRDAATLDLTPALMSASESCSEPGTSSGSEVTCELSGLLLDRTLPGWREVLHSEAYNPVEFAVRWRRRDGTYTPWAVRLSGYVWQISQQEDVVNGERISLTLRDPIMRLTQPAGIITERHPVMSILLTQNAGRPVYTGDIIQEILRVELGAAEAATMNGNGDPRRFLGDDHPPLFDRSGDTMGLWDYSPPPTGNEAALRPPYFHDAVSWIKDLIKNDMGGNENFGVFFYGFVTEGADGVPGASGETDQLPCFVYGDIGPLLADRPQWEMADAVYDAADQDLLLSQMESQTRPEKDINTWIVANTLEEKAEAMARPATNMGQSRLPDADPRSPETTWERINVSEVKSAFYDDDWCQSVAAQYAHDNAGAPVRAPRFSFARGEPTMQWGDLVRIKSLRVQLGQQGGEFALQLDDWFRITRLDNHYTNDGSDAPTFTSDAVCIMLSATEKRGWA